MRRTMGIGAVILTVVAGLAVAGEPAKQVELTGEIACAKCTLKVEGADACQSVLVVQGEADKKPMHYYLVKNTVFEEYGHVCQGTKGALVHGTVEKKDGKLWLTASKMMPPQQG